MLRTSVPLIGALGITEKSSKIRTADPRPTSELSNSFGFGGDPRPTSCDRSGLAHHDRGIISPSTKTGS